MSGNPVITFEDVCFCYPGADLDDWAVQGLNLTLSAGKSLAVVGRNGSGKSTLARLACGLLIPDRGTVTVDGHDTADKAATARVHATCGYVFQNPDDQLVASKVEDEVAFGPVNLGLERSVIAHRVAQALDAVGLAGFEQRQVASLSGGQKQRLAIAGALALEPQALALDEASSMLDPQGRVGLAVLLDRLRDKGIATLSVTHFMDEALLADTVLALDGGRVAYYGAPEGLFTDTELLGQLGLAEPFPVRMRRLLAERGVTLPFCRSIEEVAQAYLACRDGASANGRSSGAARVTAADGSAAPALDATAPVEGRADRDGMQATASSNDPSGAPASSKRATASPKGPSAAPAPNRQTAPGAAQAVVSLDHVTFSYTEDSDRNSERATLRDISLAVPAGGLVGIAGATGSGKSTLLQLAAGLLTPLEGTVTYPGAAATTTGQPADDDESHGNRKRHLFGRRRSRKAKSGTTGPAIVDGRPMVGLVFQYPERQLFAQTVIDDAMFGPRNLGRSNDEARADAQWALETVGLTEGYWERNPFSLSGGEQRRAALAGVLAMRPRLLALDEPTAGQDPARRQDLVDLIARLRRQGIGVLLATHDMELLTICDEMAVLRKGVMALQGSPNDVFADASALAACGLEPPDTMCLARLLREHGNDAPLTFDAELLADQLSSNQSSAAAEH